jgi:hypothetical protein
MNEDTPTQPINLVKRKFNDSEKVNTILNKILEFIKSLENEQQNDRRNKYKSNQFYMQISHKRITIFIKSNIEKKLNKFQFQMEKYIEKAEKVLYERNISFPFNETFTRNQEDEDEEESTTEK